MSELAVEAAPVEPAQGRGHRMLKVGAALVAVVVVVAFLHVAGVDVAGWFSDLWDQIKDLPFRTIVAGVTLQSGQTALAGLSYYGILKAAYPGEVRFAPIVTAYAVGVAMNGFLPANIGTFVTLIMFVAIIPSATFGGAIAAYLVQKIFFTIAGTFVYLYLFLSVPGSFDLNLGGLSDHPVSAVIVVVGGGILLVMLGRIFWRQVKKLWAQAKQGGVILTTPGRYLTRAFLPSFLSWLCKLGVIAVFLAGFAIPGDVRVGDVGDRLGLARKRRLGHARGRRHHAGDERARPRHVLRRPEGHGGRVLDGAAARSSRRGTSSLRPCSSCSSSAGREGSSSSAAPTTTRRNARPT